MSFSGVGASAYLEVWWLTPPSLDRSSQGLVCLHCARAIIYYRMASKASTFGICCEVLEGEHFSVPSQSYVIDVNILAGLFASRPVGLLVLVVV